MYNYQIISPSDEIAFIETNIPESKLNKVLSGFFTLKDYNILSFDLVEYLMFCGFYAKRLEQSGNMIEILMSRDYKVINMSK